MVPGALTRLIRMVAAPLNIQAGDGFGCVVTPDVHQGSVDHDWTSDGLLTRFEW
jgi:hypothetical protein